MQSRAGTLAAPFPRAWCVENGSNEDLRIVLCGHAGEHDELLAHGWSIRKWQAPVGFSTTAAARDRTASETLWCSPHCVPEQSVQEQLFG